MISLPAKLPGQPREDSRSAITLAKVASVGGDAAPEPYALARVSDMAVTPDGSMYVLDSRHLQVRIFDYRGRFLRSFGGAGSGPGEFVLPTAVTVDSVVRVFDARQGRVSSFTLQGQHLTTAMLPTPDEIVLTSLRWLSNGSVIGATAAHFSPGQANHNPNLMVVLRRANTARIDTVAQFRSEAALWHPEGRELPWGLVDSGFGQGGAWAVSGDSLVAVADGYTARVNFYAVRTNGLELVRTSGLGTQSRPVSRRDLQALEARWRKLESPAFRRARIIAPDHRSAATHAVFSETGELWIRNSANSDEGAIWSVLSVQGDLMRRLRLPRGFDLRTVRNGHLYGVARTEMGTPVVEVYQMRVRAGAAN
jgi:WD40 repeat protein